MMGRREGMEHESDDKKGYDIKVNTQATEKNRLENDLNARKKLKNLKELEKAVDLMQKPEIDSDQFFKLIDSSIQGLKEYRLIVSAIDLGVLEALKTPLSAGALAEKLGCDSVLMPHFCEALYSLGLLDRFEEGALEEKKKTMKKTNILPKTDMKTGLRAGFRITAQQILVPCIWSPS